MINDEPNDTMAAIAIGKPVIPKRAVRAIELNGAVPTTVMMPPNIRPITIGFTSIEF